MVVQVAHSSVMSTSSSRRISFSIVKKLKLENVIVFHNSYWARKRKLRLLNVKHLQRIIIISAAPKGEKIIR